MNATPLPGVCEAVPPEAWKSLSLGRVQSRHRHRCSVFPWWGEPLATSESMEADSREPHGLTSALRLLTTFNLHAPCSLLLALFLLTLPAAVSAQTLTWITNSNNTITITGGGLTNPGALTIPETISGLPVTSIGDYAFSLCFSLTSVTVPDSVISIGGGAFYGCSSLTNVAFGNRVNSIGWSAFSGCTGLSSFTIPDSVTLIWQNAFGGCASLTNVVIGNRVLAIGEQAFRVCTNLTSIFFRGNAPSPVAWDWFEGTTNATIYYLLGANGWGSEFGGRPTAPWYLPNPTILNFHTSFGVHSNTFAFTISWATNTSVVIESATNLTNPTWVPVATNALIEGSTYFADPDPATAAGRFYRLRTP